MGVIAEAVRHMLAAGMAPDDVVSAISDMESAGRNVDASAERRRAADRDRKRDARLRKSAEICGEGGISAESADTTPKEKRKVSPCTPSKEKTQPSKSLSLPSEAPPPLADDFDLSAAVEAYNSTAADAGWAKVQSLNPTRRAALKSRLRDCGGIDGWHSAMARARASPFLCGDNERRWKADFDFLLQAKSFTKLMEGAYDRRDGPQRNAFSGPVRRPSGTDQAISALAAAVARRTGGGISPDDPGGFRFDRGPEDDGGNTGGAPVSAPRLGFSG